MARENPIAAAAVSAAVAGNTSQVQTTAENLLDIDFDGAAPASLQKAPMAGASGLEGLAGTPQRVASPSIASPTKVGGMEDLMGVFGNGNGAASSNANAAINDDMMNGFASLDMDGGQPPPPQAQLDGGGGQEEE